ncbi:hypothetical protein Tco_0410963 [Tanacetum coccineum]
MKNNTVCKEKASNVFLKEREQYFEIQDLKAQLQDKIIAISELKKIIEKCKEKSVETKFDKPSVVRQPNAQRIPKPSVLGKPAPFLDSLERKSFSQKKKSPVVILVRTRSPVEKRNFAKIEEDSDELEYPRELFLGHYKLRILFGRSFLDNVVEEEDGEWIRFLGGNSSSGIKKYRGLNSNDGGNTGDGVKIAGGVIGSSDEIALEFYEELKELLPDEAGK